MKNLILVSCLAGSFVYAPHVAAKGPAQQQAAQAYAAGAEAFKAKQYPEALANFERAYKLDPVPILLYNIARCHEEMGSAQQAVDGFRLYLARAPQAPDRDDVERRIRVMEAILKRQADVPPSAPPSAGPASVVSADEPGGWQMPWGIGLASAGGLGLAASVIFGVSARDGEEAHRAAKDDATKSKRLEEAEADATAATVSAVVGGALLAGGLGLILWDVLADEPATGVEVTPLPGGAGVGWRMAF